MERVETTYADVRSTDLIVDKTGRAWPVFIDEADGGMVTLWLLDSATRIRMHFVQRPATDPVTVSRQPTMADGAAVLEAGFPAQSDGFATMEEAVAAVESIGGAVEAEVTAEEVAAAAAATEDQPVLLPAFASLDILEMRSHLYLLHGVYAHDMQSRVDTIALHDKANADHEGDRLKSRYYPHVHAEESQS